MKYIVRRKPAWPLVTAVALSFSCWVMLCAAQNAEDISDLAVHIDTIVVDRRGNPVLDLKPSDFDLREDNVAQAIDGVELKQGGRRLIAIFLDEFHVSPGASTTRARAALARFLDQELGSDDRVAVLKPLEPLNAIRVTSDRDALREAIETFAGRKGEYAPTTPFEQNFMGHAPAAIDVSRTQIVTSGLTALAARIGTLREGRTAIVLVSEGFMPGPPRRADRVPGGLQAIINSANRLGVSIYSIDPQPVRQETAAAGTGASERHALAVLSDQTGGRAFVDSDDLSQGFHQVARDLDAYYVLTYRPARAGDGKFHAVQVTVTRPDVQVRSRAGYWATAPPPDPRDPLDPLNDETLRTPSSRSPLAWIPLRPARLSPLIRPWFGMARDPDGATRVTFTWEPSGMPAKTPPVQIALKATAPDGRVLFEGTVAPVETAESGSTAGTLPERAVFRAPPGRIALEMTIGAAEGREVDSDVREIVVPSLNVRSIVMATPQVLRTRTARDFRAVSADPQSPPVPSREFSRTERLLIRVPAYGPANTTPIVTAQLQNRAGQSMRSLATVLPALPDGVSQFDLPLASIAPGDYRIELIARGASDEARDIVAFRVTD